MSKLYKILNDNQSCTAGKFDWTPYLPHDGEPGEWTPEIPYSKLRMCKWGYHGTDAPHLIGFIHGNQLFEVETRQKCWGRGENKNKFICSSMRLVRQVDTWNDKNLRLFACWCVRQVWDLLTDERSRNAVETAERYAEGLATKEELGRSRGRSLGSQGRSRGRSQGRSRGRSQGRSRGRANQKTSADVGTRI